MSPQSTIAHYRIGTKLGEGGMGEVWRATDTKLGREVAIKVISGSFAADPDRLARFTREAQVLAALNHPNIAAIYGVEDCALVMELVEGPTLAERIAIGPIPLNEALSSIGQIIDALEYAHEKGVVHRDLKPANIKVTPEGRVKVLDFGLAKALASETAASNPQVSPTLTMRATMAGTIMVTAAYMAPEQARGHDVDKRADIWAFGVVVYEMLTGRQLFGGHTVSDTLASVLKEAPDLEAVPLRLRKLLSLCLTKDPRRRLRDIGDARNLMDEAPEAAQVIATPVRTSWPVWTAALLGAAILILGMFLWRATRPQDRPLIRFSADLGPDAQAADRTTAILSPDGTRLVFLVGSAKSQQLGTRLLNQSQSSVLSGTDGAADPFFSPDGQWVGFFADSKVKKVSVLGGSPVTLCDTGPLPRGASWGSDGYIIANLDNLHLSRIPEAGGQPQMLTKPEDHGERTYRWPQVLPGSRAVLFTGSASSGSYEDANLEAMDLKTGQVKTVHRGGYFARYFPSGHLGFIHNNTLFVMPFNPERLEARGMPVPVLDDVAGTVHGAGQLDFSRDGTVVYLSGKSSANVEFRFVWMDSSGKTEPLITASSGMLTPALAPDGKRLAYTQAGDLWIYDMQRGSSARLTMNGAANRHPVWTADGMHIVFSETASHKLMWISTDGSGAVQQLLEAGPMRNPFSFSPDGRRLSYMDDSGLWTLPLDTTDPMHPKAGKPEPFLIAPGQHADDMFSPDGRWMAYSSDESGVTQVYVRPFPEGAQGSRSQVSVDGGRNPVWGPDGRELYFLEPGGHIMVSGYAIKGAVLAAERPRQWSPVPITSAGTMRSFDISPDGKRFVVTPRTSDQGPAGTVHVTVLLNFFDELKRRIR